MASEVPQIHVRIKAINEIDNWAEKHGLSRSDAINMMCVTYLEFERSMKDYVRDCRIRNGRKVTKDRPKTV